MLELTSPTRLDITDLKIDRKILESHLKYVDKRVEFEYQKAKKSRWLMQKMGEEAFQEYLQDLKAKKNKSLLFEDEKGLWTYSGLADKLQDVCNDLAVLKFKYPEGKSLPWEKVPKYPLRPYQKEAVEALLSARHAGVEIGTGLGKSFCALHLCRELGLKAVVMAPSVNIAKQLYSDFVTHLGTKNVGFFGDGKKDFKKRIVVCIAQSLVKVTPGTPAWDELSKAQVFVADESHLCPASTLQSVCFGIVANASWRFFFSGTQMRNDGLGLVLEAITGPIVYRKTVKEGVDEGYLAKPVFMMAKIQSGVNYRHSDANMMTRKHLYYNENVIKAAADIANKSVEILQRPTLILVEELEQFTRLLPYLRHSVKFAHGGVSKDNKDDLPKQFHDSDPTELVAAFNAGEFPILVGTSCVATGTDFTAVKQVIYLMGGRSEIQIKQAVGRSTRLTDGKTDCFFTDFDVEDIEVTHRHAQARKEVYADIYPGIGTFNVNT